MGAGGGSTGTPGGGDGSPGAGGEAGGPCGVSAMVCHNEVYQGSPLGAAWARGPASASTTAPGGS